MARQNGHASRGPFPSFFDLKGAEEPPQHPSQQTSPQRAHPQAGAVVTEELRNSGAIGREMVEREDAIAAVGDVQVRRERGEREREREREREMGGSSSRAPRGPRALSLLTLCVLGCLCPRPLEPRLFCQASPASVSPWLQQAIDEGGEDDARMDGEQLDETVRLPLLTQHPHSPPPSLFLAVPLPPLPQTSMAPSPSPQFCCICLEGGDLISLKHKGTTKCAEQIHQSCLYTQGHSSLDHSDHPSI